MSQFDHSLLPEKLTAKLMANVQEELTKKRKRLDDAQNDLDMSEEQIRVRQRKRLDDAQNDLYMSEEQIRVWRCRLTEEQCFRVKFALLWRENGKLFNELKKETLEEFGSRLTELNKILNNTN